MLCCGTVFAEDDKCKDGQPCTITLECAESPCKFGFAIDTNDPDMQTVQAVKHDSEADKKGVVIGMKIFEINGKKVQGKDVESELRLNDQKGSVAISFNTENASHWKGDLTFLKQRYEKCIEKIEKIEEGFDNFDDRKSVEKRQADSQKTKNAVDEVVNAVDPIFRKPPKGVVLLKPDNKEEFRRLIHDTFFMSAVDEDFSFGAHDVCRHMFACLQSEEGCLTTPKKAFEDIKEKVRRHHEEKEKVRREEL
jgi:hypothetical protein